MPINPNDIAAPGSKFRIINDDPRIQQPGATPQMDSPFGVLDIQLQQLQDSFREREGNLEAYKLKSSEHNYHVNKLQTEYDDRKFEMTQTRGALDVIQQAMAAGKMDEAAGNQAMYSLVLPREAVQAMFPKAPQMGAPASKTKREYFDEITKGAIAGADKTGAGWFDNIPMAIEQNSLAQEYVRLQGDAGYWGMGTVEQSQFDRRFDVNAKNTVGARWDPDDPIVKGLRSTGSNKLLERFASMISSFGKSLIEEKRRQQKEEGQKKKRSIRGFGGMGGFGVAPPPRTAPTQTTGQDASRSQLLARYKALGGSKTQAGRDFADQNLR